MSALFARVVKQALITFECENAPAFKTNFSLLKQLVNQLTSNDLNIPSELFAASSFQDRPNRAPVKYIEIFEHKTFTMSVFIMENKYTMPIHDHPGHGKENWKPFPWLIIIKVTIFFRHFACYCWKCSCPKLLT